MINKKTKNLKQKNWKSKNKLNWDLETFKIKLKSNLWNQFVGGLKKLSIEIGEAVDPLCTSMNL